MKLIIAKQHCSDLNLDPEEGAGSRRKSKANSTSCMCVARVMEERRKRSKVWDGDAGTEVWREDA